MDVDPGYVEFAFLVDDELVVSTAHPVTESGLCNWRKIKSSSGSKPVGPTKMDKLQKQARLKLKDLLGASDASADEMELPCTTKQRTHGSRIQQTCECTCRGVREEVSRFRASVQEFPWRFLITMVFLFAVFHSIMELMTHSVELKFQVVAPNNPPTVSASEHIAMAAAAAQGPAAADLGAGQVS